ncbi:MAG: DUF389 domain-containing protein [Hyphomicrobiales bacterium]
MIHLRVIVPPAHATEALVLLTSSPGVINVVHFPGAARKPQGDLILCDVAREAASYVIDDLRTSVLPDEGTIAVEQVDLALSEAAEEAKRQSEGAPGDAVVWEEVEAKTLDSAELSYTFLAFMVASTLIAAFAILTDSLVLLIGAMILGPDFGPLAGVSVAVVQRRFELARRSLVALIVGFPVGITAAWIATVILRAFDRGPIALSAEAHDATLFISHPNIYSFLVALVSGIAGVLSLSTSKASALIGVLVSVTTIPAAANIGVATAYQDWPEWRGSMQQLSINVAALVAAGTATLWLQRQAYLRNRLPPLPPFLARGAAHHHSSARRERESR